jgi:hypothetical protein
MTNRYFLLPLFCKRINQCKHNVMIKQLEKIFISLFLKNHDVSENILNRIIALRMHETYYHSDLPANRINALAYNHKGIFPFPLKNQKDLLLYPAVI